MGYNCQDMRAANLLMGSHPNVLVMTLIVAGIDRVLHGLLGWILKVISCLRCVERFRFYTSSIGWYHGRAFISWWYGRGTTS